MAKRAKLEERLRALSGLAEDVDANREAIANYLDDKSNHVVAKAVELISAFPPRDFEDKLRGIFEHFMENPVKRDPGCKAKHAVVEALGELPVGGEDVFWRSVRYRQLEPSFGPPVDTAVNLRVSAAMGLAQHGVHEVWFETTELLMDCEATVRAGAAKVLTYLGGESAELVLRTKVLSGDAEPEVTAECLSGLMQIEPNRSLDFVASKLDGSDRFLAESAALALGESRLPEAWQRLREDFERKVHPDDRHILLLPIALTRQPEATEFLLNCIRSGPPRLAEEALAAMRIYSGDIEIREALTDAVTKRRDRELSARLRDLFD